MDPWKGEGTTRAESLMLLNRATEGGQVLGFSVNVQDVAGGCLAEVRTGTAGVGLNTRQMRAGIGGPGKRARGEILSPIVKQVKASGIPRSLAMPVSSEC